VRRDRPVLLYDGDCSFCTLSARWVERRLPVVPDLQPWQQADLAGLGVAEAEAMHSVQWVEPSGRVTSGAAAVARLLVSNGGAWAVLGRLMLVPPISWAAALAYRLVATFRGRLPGVTPACALPESERPGASDATRQPPASA
jgi:predicted DCC family thiol-disulfide oxidoreductase YuxK